jgi:type IV pilus assembly protein PilO
MGQFASDIAQLSRIVTLNDIIIAPGGKDGSVLAMDTTAKTFRYLDEEEVAKQKKAVAAAKNPPKAAAAKPTGGHGAGN